MKQTAQPADPQFAAGVQGSSLYNDDLAPTGIAQRTWKWYHFAALWVGNLRGRWGSDRIVSASAIVFAAATVPVALTGSIAVVIAATFVAGMAWVSTLTTLNVAMQLRSPEAILGRCLSIYQAVTFGAMALGAYLLGLAADIWSLPNAILLSAGWLGLTALLLPFLAPMPARDEGRIDP